MAKISAIDITSLLFQEGSAPSTPASTKWRVYFKTDGLYVIDDAGTETGPLGETGASLGAWTDYTPTLTGSSSNPTVGNGTIDGRYKLLDSTTGIVQVRFQFGSTSNAGSGDWIFSLPSGWVVASNMAYQTGSAHLLDAGTKHMPGTVKFAAGESTTDEIIYGLATGNGIVAHNQPFTWANGDQLNFSALLELSSS